VSAVEAAEQEHADMNVEHAHHAHPGDGVYIRVAAFLAAATAIEVLLSYNNVGGEHGTIALLLILAAVKFFTVVMYFMHLKFDHPWFRRLFAIGLGLAVFCYVVYLSTLHAFLR
jgi:cytochrome c oxidase subunit 4